MADGVAENGPASQAPGGLKLITGSVGQLLGWMGVLLGILSVISENRSGLLFGRCDLHRNIRH